MRTRRTKEQIRKDNYNKDVDAYNFYVVNLDTKRAETGFEFKEDAVYVLNDYDDKKKYKVVSKRALKSMGIENPNESFKYEGGGDFQSGVYATGGGVDILKLYQKDVFSDKDSELINEAIENGDIDTSDIQEDFMGYAYERIDKEYKDEFETEDIWQYTDEQYENGLTHKENYKNLISFLKNDDNYAKGGGVQGKINQSKNIFQKQDLIRERYELLNDMYNNEDSNVDYTDIIKVGDVLYGDDINGYARIYREVNDPEKGDYFILQDRYNNKFAFLIIQTIRDLYAKELYIQNVNIPQKDFLYSDEVIDLNNQLEFHKGRINLYKKNPNDASNYSGINYSDYMSSQSKVKELEDKLSLALKDEGHKFAKGGSLIGNQKRIDLNKNGKIDAEDFKLLRTTMNGGWRKDHKYVNSSNPKEDYEVIYARKYKPSRKGYKGKTNFATGGGVGRFSEYSNDALYDMMINLSRYENTESDIQMVKAELEKRKGENKGVIEEMDLFDDKRLRLRKPVMPERKMSEQEWAEKHNPRAYEFMGKRKMATGGGVNVGYNVFNYTDDIYATDEVFKTKTLANKFIKEFRNRFVNQGYYRDNRMNKINIEDIDLLAIPSDFNPYKKYANGGGVDYEYDGIAYAKTKALQSIDWDKELREYAGSEYSKLTTREKEEIISDMQRDWNSRHSFASGGAFEKLSDKVAKNYEGKLVKPQYQKEYGKVYSKSEAKEVGDKVAGKVKANQKMASGGEVKLSDLKVESSMGAGKKTWEVSYPKIQGKGVYFQDQYTKEEAKEHWLENVASKYKFATGGETKKGARGGIMTLAKKIRKDGESWQDAVKRAGQQLK